MAKVLSAFPYYGGKAKMSPLICSLLDYDNTDIYIEPYGGGCRTLFNKQKHEQEIYNDFSFGLTSFMDVMSRSDLTEQLIEKLYYTTPTKELFDTLVIERMKMEDRLLTDDNAQLIKLANACYRKYPFLPFKELGKHLRQERYKEVIQTLEDILSVPDSTFDEIDLQPFIRYHHLYCNYWNLVGSDYQAEYDKVFSHFTTEWNQKVNMEGKSKKLQADFEYQRDQGAHEWALDKIHEYTNDLQSSNKLGETVDSVDVAYTIFLLYYCSRDGMGEVWSAEKNRNIQSYYRAVRNLRKVSERMGSVVITQVDALYLIHVHKTNPLAMIYLDPSYLKPEDESQNLGGVYKYSYEYEEHKRLLEEITSPDTQAKILISNYDAELYNSYLYNWDKRYYKTFTGVGSKKGNRRLEVLWKNY